MLPFAPSPPQSKDNERLLVPQSQSLQSAQSPFAVALRAGGNAVLEQNSSSSSSASGNVMPYGRPATMEQETTRYGPEGIVSHAKRSITFSSPEKSALRQQVARLGDDNYSLRQELSRAAEVVGQQQIYYKTMAE